MVYNSLQGAQAWTTSARVPKQGRRGGRELREDGPARTVAQLDLDDSDGEPLYEDPRQNAWSDLPQDLREVPKHEAVEALRSLVRAAAGPELKFWVRAGAETTAGGARGGNDLGGGFGGWTVLCLRPGRRIVGLGVFWGACE
jgi:hypothetical protein